MPDPRATILRLPPFSFIRSFGPLGRLLTLRSFLGAHFLILGALYSIFLCAAGYEQTLILSAGIGVFQNYPFYAHLASGIFAFPLVWLIARNIASTATNVSPTFLRQFHRRLSRNKLKILLYALGVLVGLASLAYGVVLAATYTIVIYDSVQYPWTFVLYIPIRVYLFLFCYPFSIASVVTIIIVWFRTVRASNVAYDPFHPDSLGGLRKYLRAIDRPMFALQILTISIALMNYIGWGSFVLVPTLLSIAAPLIVTLLAVLLYYSFYSIYLQKRAEEIARLCEYEKSLYIKIRGADETTSRSSLVDEIEAIERLISLIKRRKDYTWLKYVATYIPIVLSKIPKEWVSSLLSYITSSQADILQKLVT